MKIQVFCLLSIDTKRYICILYKHYVVISIIIFFTSSIKSRCEQRNQINSNEKKRGGMAPNAGLGRGMDRTSFLRDVLDELYRSLYVKPNKRVPLIVIGTPWEPTEVICAALVWRWWTRTSIFFLFEGDFLLATKIKIVFTAHP